MYLSSLGRVAKTSTTPALTYHDFPDTDSQSREPQFPESLDHFSHSVGIQMNRAEESSLPSSIDGLSADHRR